MESAAKLTSVRQQPAPRRGVAIFFGTVALCSGVMGFLTGGMKGRSAGWEEMLIYAVPSVVCALIAIAVRRSAISYAALVGAVLGIIGFVLGA